jgi:hypothetical protein
MDGDVRRGSRRGRSLAGLLFVALTVNLPRVLPDAAHVARAREALAGLLSLLVMALLVLIPGQAGGALGIELLGLAAVLAAFSIGFQVQTMRRLPPQAASSLGRADAAGQRGHGHDDRGRCLPHRRRRGRPGLAGGDRGGLCAAISLGCLGAAD